MVQTHIVDCYNVLITPRLVPSTLLICSLDISVYDLDLTRWYYCWHNYLLDSLHLHDSIVFAIQVLGITISHVVLSFITTLTFGYIGWTYI
jgi:hypothetical protein